MRLSVSFKKIREYKKYEDLFDFQAVECWMSLLISVLLAIVLAFMSVKTNANSFTELLSELVKDIAMAFVGLLGFSVSGLAILTGAISKKVVEVILKVGKIKNLERILLSFYFQALVIATIIVSYVGVYILLFVENPYIWQLVFGITLVLGYLSAFSILYSVKLVGNCIDIFEIVNSVDEVPTVTESNVDIRKEYESIKLRALETVVLKNNPSLVSEYRDLIDEQIRDSCFDESVKSKLWYNYKRHFNIQEQQEKESS